MEVPEPNPDDVPSVQAGSGSGLPLEAGLGFRLDRLARTLRRGWADELSVLSLTPPQAAVLRGVAGAPGCSLRALARALGTDPTNAKRCVDELEQHDLLSSAHRAGDRRSRTLALSDAGAVLAGRVDVLVRGQERRLDTLLGPAGRRRLEEALTRLEAALPLPATGRRAAVAVPADDSSDDSSAPRTAPAARTAKDETAKVDG